MITENPYRPGAGHTPPFLAGRETEMKEFKKLLKQKIILNNMVLTGLRGVGKTVLLEKFRPVAQSMNWMWVGTDLSESASVNEETLATRLLTDLSVITSSLIFRTDLVSRTGFNREKIIENQFLTFENLCSIYNAIPGLQSDKLKGILEIVWESLKDQNVKGVIFAYDEAQTISNHSKKEQYPLSMLLDVFQSIQKKEIPFMLVLTGLPMLFPQLVEARTFAERMFSVVFLSKLEDSESEQAILIPLKKPKSKVIFTDESVETIIDSSGGYPYFIQFICREIFDVFLINISAGKPLSVPINEIILKLDRDFFAGRWAKATDRQRELLSIIAQLDNCGEEFNVQDVVEVSKEKLNKPFSSSHINQMLLTLSKMGLIYKNRHGKYSFAVPLLGKFILRQNNESN